MLARQQIRARPARTEDGAVRWRMYDTISVTEKKLQWIEGTTARWDGYLEFQRRLSPCSTGSPSTCPDPAASTVNDAGHRLRA